jgi:peptide/nickel transport system ATP-binding protein
MRTEEEGQRTLTPAPIRAVGLSKSYVQRAPFSHNKFVIDALVDVQLEVTPATLTALVGESGSGKSTLARCLAMLETPDCGEIWFEGKEISRSGSRDLACLRPKIQMIHQDSAGALNPRFTAAQVIAEPLEIQRRGSGLRLRSRVCELMEEVGLPANWADRRPLELSGGQRQRLAIARAIALKPAFLILDESLSGLDLSTQAQILNLLLDLQKAHSLTYLLISHDLSLVGQVADFVAVMHQGRMVEHGARQDIFGNPRHAHTRELLGSVRLVESAFRTAQAGGRQ